MQQDETPVPLSAGDFQDSAKAHPQFACVMHQGPYAACAAQVEALRDGDDGPWHWASIDLGEAPDVATMFGIAGEEPWLLVMREEVVLYREPLSARPVAETRRLLARAAALDMQAVHQDVAQQRMARDSLHSRRVCPTVMRSPG
ncbi:MAG: hypothetical protein RIB84_10600 [Sneathiellaceae bacterium]